MSEKNFDAWFVLKKRVHDRHAFSSRPGGDRFFQVRDVWFCSIGENIGHEQDGKHTYFERPVLIVQKFNHDMFWGVPLTSNLKQGRYCLEIFFAGRYSSAMHSQLRLWDARRLLRKIDRISESDHRQITEKIISILKLSGSPHERGASEPEGVVK